MKPKRPRINNTRNLLDRSQNSVIENDLTEHVGTTQDYALFESKLFENEKNTVLLKETFDPLSMIDYHLESNAKLANSGDERDENNTSVKEIYNTIDFDQSF